MATSLINTECKRYGCMKNLLACYANCKYNSRCEELRGEVLPNLEQAQSDINAYRNERGASAIEIQMTKRGLKFIEVLSVKKPAPQPAKRVAANAPLGKEKSQAAAPALKPAQKKFFKEKPKLKLPVAPINLAPVARQTATKLPAAKSVVKVKKAQRHQAAQFTAKAPASVREALEPLGKKTKPPVSQKRRAGKKKITLKMEMQSTMPKRAKELDTATMSDSRDHNASLAEGNATNPSLVGDKPSLIRKKTGKADAAAKKKKKMFIILDGNNSALVDERGLMAKLLTGVSPNARYFEATEIELRLQIAYKK
ncbi:MAG: hypothetical protein HY231_02260 [Acidobacteria bacterium]|nr:hypothetical protein [Acidobacteriota bacterium]